VVKVAIQVGKRLVDWEIDCSWCFGKQYPQEWELRKESIMLWKILLTICLDHFLYLTS